MSRGGQFPSRSSFPRARSTPASRIAKRRNIEWSFARATVERSTARRSAEGMAPRPGADHARDDCIGSANAGSALSNADRGIATSRGGGSRARTGVPVRPSSTAETGCSGFRPHDASTSGRMRIRTKGASWQGLAFAGTPRARTSGASTSRRRRNEVFGESRGVSSSVREVRDGCGVAQAGTRSTPKGVRRSNRHRWKASRVVEVCVRVTAAQREIISAGQANVARLRGWGRAQGPRQRRQR